MNDEDPLMTDDDIRKLIDDVDIDGDGEIDYNEFISMMKKDQVL